MRFDRIEALSASDARCVPFSLDFRAKGPERDFAMVARADRLLDHRLAFSKKPGKEHARLHLRTRHLRLVVNGFQRTAHNFQRWPSALKGLDLCAHLRQRRYDASHRPARE